jgi:hypothetical protein
MKRQFDAYNYITLILIILTSITANAQKMLENGDFESVGSGNGFLVTSPYSLAITPGTSIQGNYSFVTDPSLMNSSFISGDTIFMNLNWVSLPFLRFTNLFKK